MQDLLKETAGLPSLVAATSHTKDKLYHQMSSFSSRTIKLITVYIFSSYLTHFRLFQFVFTCARDTDQMTRHLTVDCPTDFMSMRDGKEESAWLKEQELQSIDKKREQRLKTMEVKREQELQGIEILRHKLLNEVDVGVSDIPDVTQLATQAVQDQLNATSRILYGEIEDHGSRMNVHMETLALKSPVFAPALESTLSVPLIGKTPSGGTVSMPTKGKASPKPAQSKKNEKKKKGKN
ncbi:uncharacterized protein LOC134183159 isoform X2 [Corticium candelabrum]|nr:uncharacterized protein LOC134183159 isoform X2 [Corticium candelabrum]